MIAAMTDHVLDCGITDDELVFELTGVCVAVVVDAVSCVGFCVVVCIVVCVASVLFFVVALDALGCAVFAFVELDVFAAT